MVFGREGLTASPPAAEPEISSLLIAPLECDVTSGGTLCALGTARLVPVDAAVALGTPLQSANRRLLRSETAGFEPGELALLSSLIDAMGRLRLAPVAVRHGVGGGCNRARSEGYGRNDQRVAQGRSPRPIG